MPFDEQQLREFFQQMDQVDDNKVTEEEMKKTLTNQMGYDAAEADEIIDVSSFLLTRTFQRVCSGRHTPVSKTRLSVHDGKTAICKAKSWWNVTKTDTVPKRFQLQQVFAACDCDENRVLTEQEFVDGMMKFAP